MAKVMKNKPLRYLVSLATILASLCLTMGAVLPVTTNSGRVCDAERDVTISAAGAKPFTILLGTETADEAHNLAVLNSAFARVGHGNDTLNPSGSLPAIYDPLYLAGKTFYTNPGITITGVGGQLLTGGGMMYPWFEQQRGAGVSSVTTLVAMNGDLSTPLITYGGFGWRIGPLNLYAVPVYTNSQAANLLAGTYGVPRRAVGLEVAGNSTAVGQLQADAMAFTGFVDAIHASASVTNGDRLHFQYVSTAYCNHLFHSNNGQCVLCSFDHVTSFTPHDSLFWIEDGGDITVGDCDIEGGGGTLLKIDGEFVNTRRITIHNLRVDNPVGGGVLGEKLIEIGGTTQNVTIVIDGNYCNGEALNSYPTDPLVVLPVGWDASTLATKHIVIRLDVGGISPTTAALYPR